MSSEKRARLKQWLESGEARLEPLTFPQRELAEATPVPLGDPANHICSLITLHGRLTSQDCENIMLRVVERQEALRTSLLPGRDGALQMIRRSVSEPNLRFSDLPATEELEARAQEVFREPFDLVGGPLYRAEIMRRGPKDLVFAFSIHHAVADGWSLGILVRELAHAYAQKLLGRWAKSLPPVALTYSAWGATERAAWQPVELERCAAFWKTTLAGASRLFPAQPDSPPGLDRWVTELPEKLPGAVRALAKRTGATLFSTLLTAFQIALWRWRGAEDIVVGTPVANRQNPAARETIGYFAGVVPLRGQVERDRTFAESLRAAHETSMDAFAHAMPFAELMRAVGDAPAPGHHPVFDVRFALQNHPVPDITLPMLSARLRMRSTGTARFHLGCEITERGSAMEVVWLSRPSLFSRDDIADLARIFHAVLAGACRSAESRILSIV